MTAVGLLKRAATQEMAFTLAIFGKAAFEQTDPGHAGCIGSAFRVCRHLVELRPPFAHVTAGSQSGQLERLNARSWDFRELLRVQRAQCARKHDRQADRNASAENEPQHS